MGEASMLKVALAQMNSVDSISENLEVIRRCILKAKGADLICFPENCLYFRILEGEKIQGVTSEHEALLQIGRWASENHINVHLGSVPLAEANRMYNSSVWITAEGKVCPSYRKIHLFDIDLGGRAPIRESDVFSRGVDISVQELQGWKIGESICYDLRFSELYLKYAQVGVDLILIPSAFLVPTGRAHWECLVRARAIECQAYVVASAQAGLHQGIAGGQRETHGHSLVVGPWGEKLGDLGPEGEVVKIFELKKEEVAKVRKQIPMASHRRL